MSKAGILRPRQQRLVEALQTSATIRGAAQAAGIPPATCYRWLREAPVKAALREHHDNTMAQGARVTATFLTEALRVLAETMRDVNTPAAVRVSAARAMIEAAARFTDVVILSERVSQLESATLPERTW